MAGQVNIGGVWKNIAGVYVNIGGAWKTASSMKCNIGGIWKNGWTSIDSYTKALLHFDGTDGSTTFTDETGRTWTAAGNAQIDTAQKKFGTASGLFDGASYIDTPDSVDHEPGTGDFSVDFRVRFAVNTGLQMLFARRTEDGSQNDFFGGYINSGVLTFLSVVNKVTKAQYRYTWNPSINTWYHLEFTRNGSNFYMFIEGDSKTLTVDTAINTNDLTFSLTGERLTIGRQGNLGANYFNGWIDEFRFSKGIARHTSNFTPPTFPY